MPKVGSKVEVTDGCWVEISDAEQAAYTRDGCYVAPLDNDGHKDAPVLAEGAPKGARREQIMNVIRDKGLKRPAPVRR